MNSILFKLAKKLVNPVKLVTWALRAAGDGTLGEPVKKVYWLLRGKKGYIVAGLTALGAFLVELQHSAPADCGAIHCSALLEYLKAWGPVIVSGLTVSAIDDAIHSEAPEAPKK